MSASVSVPGFEILGTLGRGGFGVVYRARQVSIDREVAIKIDTRVLLDDRDQRRFLREVQAAGRLSGHPNVVEIYDAGVLPDNRPYIVMELCPGGSLGDRRQLPPAEVASIGHKIADALVAAHDLGVLHRDIKPANILVKRYGTPGLADFGLAALVDTGREASVTLASLTPAYAPPEAFRMETPTARSDIYALGATLYALLAGRPPRFPEHGEVSIPQILKLHDETLPDLPHVSPALIDVLRRAMATDPAQRFADAADLRDALAAHVGLTPERRIAPPPPPPAPMPSPPRRTRRWLPLAAAAGVLAVAAGAGAWFLINNKANQPGAQQNPPTTSSVDQFGVATVGANCPAATVDGGRAVCTEKAECWSGQVVINGVINAIDKLECGDVHVYETFAIAPLPEGVKPKADALAASPIVAKVCSMDTLLASRFDKALPIGADQWVIEVLGPTPEDREAKRQVFRCVATVKDKDVTGSAFRPR